jgi:hypothetical protein
VQIAQTKNVRSGSFATPEGCCQWLGRACTHVQREVPRPVSPAQGSQVPKATDLVPRFELISTVLKRLTPSATDAKTRGGDRDLRHFGIMSFVRNDLRRTVVMLRREAVTPFGPHILSEQALTPTKWPPSLQSCSISPGASRLRRSSYQGPPLVS